jgi:hypothetical protein
MSHYIDPRQRTFEAQHNAVLNTIYDFGPSAHVMLAKRELLSDHMAANDVRRQLRQTPAGPGPMRRWLATRTVALGAWLAGAQAGLESSAAGADEATATRAAS